MAEPTMPRWPATYILDVLSITRDTGKSYGRLPSIMIALEQFQITATISSLPTVPDYTLVNSILILIWPLLDHQSAIQLL
jgi:hypothetical protein